jgi:hypothetical protein
LGGAEPAKNLELIKKNNIQAVLTCAAELKIKYDKDLNIE